MGESDVNSFNLDLQARIENSLKSRIDRLPISDRIVLSKIRQLPMRDQSFNPYRDAISKFFDGLVCKYEVDEKGNYLDLKLRLLKDVLQELWVIKARKGETFKLFQNFESFEKMLFQSNPDYRGHYVHQFDVFLLGYYILNKILENTNTEIYSKFKPDIERDPNLTWMLASTFHDIGYPIEKIDSWFSMFLSTFLSTETKYPIEIEKILSPVFFDYLNFLSEEHYNQTIEPIPVSGQSVRDWKLHNTLLNNLRTKKDHGIVSSLLLIHSLFTQETFGKFDDWFNDTFVPDIMPACHAISIHNLKEKISLKQSPFAFLLVLCDNIQDWERSISGQNPSELKGIEVAFNGEIPIVEIIIQINSEKKFEEFDKLKLRLTTCGLARIKIKQENGNKEWII